MKTIALSVTALLVITAFPVVHAENTESTARFLALEFYDLDLNTHSDAVTLYGRLRTAALRVCASQRGISLRERQQHDACVDHALQSSVAKLDRPVLSRYAAEHSGRHIARERIADGR